MENVTVNNFQKLLSILPSHYAECLQWIQNEILLMELSALGT
jgi:hypothetical protein